MFLSLFWRTLLPAALLCGASQSPVWAQQVEFSLSGGGQLSRSNLAEASGNPSFGALLTLKSGIVFGSQWGIGLFYERANLQAEVTRPYPLGTYSYRALVATPQHSFGLELYRKIKLPRHTGLRLGILLGYAQAAVPVPTLADGQAKTSGASVAGGLDAAFVFPLLRRLKGVAGTGFRISHLQYKTHPEQTAITTVGIPFSLGLHYTFGTL